MKWNSQLYNEHHDFVYQFGKGMLDLLAPQASERILDLGCGTGELTNEIAASGASVKGIDSSAEMIATANERFPNIEFDVMDAAKLNMKNEFDAVFSNAALHWMIEKDAVVKSVWNALKPGGRFVAEMGGKDNIAAIKNAIEAAMRKKGLEIPVFWYFPSSGEYASLLEEHGFRVSMVQHFRRVTPLKGDEGMANWIKMFGVNFFEKLNEQEVDEIIKEAVINLKDESYHNGEWIADYYRLRVVAYKQ